MALNNIFDYEFFDELEKQISPVIANNSVLQDRLIYGALYGFYKFNRGRPENLLFFETALEEEPSVLHCDMSSVLFQLAHEATIMDRDRLELMTINFFKPNMLLNWDKEVKYKQRLIANYHRIFMKINYVDEEVWRKLIECTIRLKRVNNMEDYDTMLKGLMWYNDNPKSPKFQKISNELEIFRDKIRKNENRLWKYDPETANWRTYEDLLKSREEIDETYAYTFVSEAITKGDKKEVIEKKDITIEEVKKLVAEKLKQSMPILKIKAELLEVNAPPEYIEQSLVEIAKENQKKNVDSMRKKGIFVPEMSIKELEDMKNKERKVAKVAAGAPAAGGKKEGGKAKK